MRRATPKENEIIRPRDLPQLTGLSRTTIWRLEKAKEFVQRIRLTRHSIGYRRVDIERWLEARAE
uniref:Phage transcriptional regulator, AlpA n=1 Tax=Geobacter sp. (strain M21) TaxID=443144 RepID=C6E131_GEOSM